MKRLSPNGPVPGSMAAARWRILTICTLLAAFGSLLACAGLPRAPDARCERIPTGPGPEDFAVDRSQSRARILVSSHDRRKWTRGDIFVVDPARNEPQSPQVFPRVGEPPGLHFSPHGMDIHTFDGRTYLYVINHGPHQNSGPQQVLVYEVLPDSLRFANLIETTLFTSPNDLAVDPRGGVYVTNDSASRGSFLEMALALRRATVVYCAFHPGGAEKPACVVAADKLAMANGVAVRGEAVYVSTSRGDELLAYRRRADGTLTEPRVVFRAPTLDNLFFREETRAGGNEGAGTDNAEILVASHPSGLRFLRHVRNPQVLSPSVIYGIRLSDGRSRVVYSNDGSEIPAASGAFFYEGRLYVSQVFESHLLRCSGADLADDAGGATPGKTK